MRAPARAGRPGRAIRMVALRLQRKLHDSVPLMAKKVISGSRAIERIGVCDEMIELDALARGDVQEAPYPLFAAGAGGGENPLVGNTGAESVQGNGNALRIVTFTQVPIVSSRPRHSSATSAPTPCVN